MIYALSFIIIKYYSYRTILNHGTYIPTPHHMMLWSYLPIFIAGGEDAFLRWAGKDCTEAFKGTQHSQHQITERGNVGWVSYLYYSNTYTYTYTYDMLYKSIYKTLTAWCFPGVLCVFEQIWVCTCHCLYYFTLYICKIYFAFKTLTIRHLSSLSLS